MVLFGAKLAIGVALTYWLLQSGRLDLEVFQRLSVADEGLGIAAVLVLQFAALVLVLGRWWLLLRAQDIPLSLRTTLVISFRGMSAGLLVPGILGLDGARMLYMQQFHRSRLPEGIASMLLDRVLGFLGLMILASVAGSYFVLSHPDPHVWMPVAGLVVVTVLAGIVIASLCGIVPDIGFRILRRFRFLTRLVDSFPIYRDHWPALLTAVAISVLAHFLMCVAACAALAVLGIPFDWVAIMTITPLVIFIRFLPLAPMGLGISDSAAESLYRLVGVDGGAESQMLLRATMLVLLVLAGTAFLLRAERRSDQSTL